MQELDLKLKTLKSEAYDTFGIIQQLQGRLTSINQAIESTAREMKALEDQKIEKKPKTSNQKA